MAIRFQTAIDNSVAAVDIRYSLALKTIDKCRCPLRLANDSLFDEIQEAMVEWAMYESNITDEEFEELDAEEIFG